MIQTNAISFGSEAAALCGTTGRVLGVLGNAVYLESDRDHVVGVVGEEAPDSPITLRVSDLHAVLLALNGRDRLRFQASQERLEIGEAARIFWRGSQHYSPKQPPALGTPSARTQAVDTLATLIMSGEPREGCGRLTPFLQALTPGDADPAPLQESLAANPLLRRVALLLIELHAGIREACSERATSALTGLLGLGPGLTPSGDDMAAGILASLVWQARLGAMPGLCVSRLVGSVRKAAPRRTNRISARMLLHAGGGVLYAPAMSLGVALLAGDLAGMHAPARQLFQIGNSSGVDLAIGLLFGSLVGVSN